MRVLFNAGATRAGPLTGVGHYASQLMQALQDPAFGLDLVPFADGKPSAEPVAPAPASAWCSAAFSLPGARTGQAVLRSVMARHAARHLRGDVYHEPNHVLQPVRAPAVLTVHDLSVLRFPHWHPRDRAAYFRRRFVPSVGRAAIILAVSEFTRRELIALLRVPEERVRVTPLAAGPQFRPHTPEEIRPVLARLGLQPGYVLSLGTQEPRKNLPRLLDAWDGLRDRPPLVLAGPPGWRAEALDARLHGAKNVHRLGYVADADRPALYAGAAAFAYPSLYEGFGLPPLEAAACGTPVLTSLGTPMAETFAGAAVLVDPADVGAIRDGLAQLLAGGGPPRAAGQAIAAAHTWHACAVRTAEAYRAAAA